MRSVRRRRRRTRGREFTGPKRRDDDDVDFGDFPKIKGGEEVGFEVHAAAGQMGFVRLARGRLQTPEYITGCRNANASERDL